MGTQFSVLSHVQRLNEYVEPVSIPLTPMETVALSAYAWSLVGLWIWLSFEGYEGRSRSFFRLSFTFFCGPAAWVTALWIAMHRPPRTHRGLHPMKTEHRVWPENWRN